jgi:hypothetical protein
MEDITDTQINSLTIHLSEDDPANVKETNGRTQ